jgi:predicted short-subunit dehydrogenase-like oxidoreductase (DUF2520 family)
MKLGRTISKKCHFISSRDRARIHLGAVLVNNFTNHLMQVAFEIAGSKASRDKLLKSLAESTVRNAFEAGPHKSQTGPARRGDLKTIRKHVTMLRTKPAAQRLYRIFSREIINKYNR